MRSVEAVFAKWRHGMTIMSLGFKLGTMALQSAGAGRSRPDIGLKWTTRGPRAAFGDQAALNPVEFYRRIKETYREVAEKSPFMAARLHTGAGKSRRRPGNWKRA